MQFLRQTLFGNHCLLCKRFFPSYKCLSSIRTQNPDSLILGIETSCDDTGVAIVNTKGEILGQSLFSQTSTSVRFGGVVPSIAMKLHKNKLRGLTEEAISNANIDPNDLSAIAVTVKPGLIQSLRIGIEYAKELACKYNKPLIPIHHMEAHALTARMIHKIEFPYLVLLISGGHCILVLGEDIDSWHILAKGLDEAPGTSLDKAARRLKLRNLEGFDRMAGGRAIQTLAAEGNPNKHIIEPPRFNDFSANFSFSGMRAALCGHIEKLEDEHGIEGPGILPDARHLCASFQLAMTKHIARRTQKVMDFIRYKELLPPTNLTLVVSGGVACNQFIRSALQKLCNAEDYRLVVPPPHLCTDNGIMIAWNGIERWKQQKGILYDPIHFDDIIPQNECPIGPEMISQVKSARIKSPKWAF